MNTSLIAEIIIYILSASGATLLLIQIAKFVIIKLADASIEKYKNSLQKDVEQYKIDLIRVTQEHQIKFSKLHEERASRIKNLYQLVVELEYALLNATTIAQSGEFMDDLQRDEVCYKKRISLIHQLDLDRIYFPDDTLTKFERILQESWDITSTMRKARRYAQAFDDFAKRGKDIPPIYKSCSDLWHEADERTQKQFKDLKGDLAADFRKLLGISQ